MLKKIISCSRSLVFINSYIYNMKDLKLKGEKKERISVLFSYNLKMWFFVFAHIQYS